MAGQVQDQALLDALRHPLRRSLLQRCVESDQRQSLKELARSAEQPLSSVSYHLTRLAEPGVIERAGDLQIGWSVVQLYRLAPWVRESSQVPAALGLKEG